MPAFYVELDVPQNIYMVLPMFLFQKQSCVNQKQKSEKSQIREASVLDTSDLNSYEVAKADTNEG